jgi:hypothetical protein
MPNYHIYAVGSDGRFVAVEELECADDQEAIKKASKPPRVAALSCGKANGVSSDCCPLRASNGICLLWP